MKQVPNQCPKSLGRKKYTSKAVLEQSYRHWWSLQLNRDHISYLKMIGSYCLQLVIVTQGCRICHFIWFFKSLHSKLHIKSPDFCNWLKKNKKQFWHCASQYEPLKNNLCVIPDKRGQLNSSNKKTLLLYSMGNLTQCSVVT